MKRTILILAISLISTAIFAQSKDTVKSQIKKEIVPPPAPKPQFTIDPSKKYSITLTLTSGDVGIITIDPDDWRKEVRHNHRYLGDQIGEIEDIHAAIRKEIADQFNKLVQADFEKFKADTAAKVQKTKARQ